MAALPAHCPQGPSPIILKQNNNPQGLGVFQLVWCST